jgi:thioesterase domain-containing protein
VNNVPSTLVFLTGAGAGRGDWSRDAAFRAVGAALKGRGEESIRLEPIKYPNWPRFLSGGFSMEILIAELVEQIVTKVPEGRVSIVGYSIGGHLGYACALRLQAIGREIAGFCAIDSAIITSSEPRPGWIGRHLEGALRLLHDGRFHELPTFLRTRFWRVQLRLLLRGAPALIRILARSERGPALAALDPILEGELNGLLTAQEAAPWIASLERDPVAMNAPAVLLRTPETAGDDAAWQRRCPNIEIIEIDGNHTTLFQPENVGSFCEALLAGTHNWRLGICP